ncbi:uncharacterized protein PHACADRAFT_258640 [Phanerochaete carnosa HHB-10118-sp]|uniref:Histone chaperone domain-containing protein n=1 Tax=Phanerochaete carnosa (strain HHB-10118-sp) TaxID=650164 RepID=K5VSZ6_PHACS|nr:uncharacterized protein PHACADRAFT_258640 [Phanerochaete carnosa HHB-10118-sp]EKM54648.1 hypothetical protein PHACADRAFT_258640 [Phanerochaete carnosa HHB-10118-sp]
MPPLPVLRFSKVEISNQELNNDKGKGKIVQDDSMIEDDEDDEEEDDEEDEDEDEEMAEEESLDDIDPSVIRPRRTRGVRVDYTSPEALAKAGIKPEELNEDAEQEDTYDAKDDEMRDD